MTRPQEGGYFYARHAVDFCSRNLAVLKIRGDASVQSEIARTGTLGLDRAREADRLFALCGSFAPDEAAAMAADVRTRIQDGRDPLAAAEAFANEAILHPDAAKLRAAAARLLELADPLLLSNLEMLRRIASADPEARAQQGVVFDGQVVPLADGLRHSKAMLALELGACRPDAPCALDDDLRFACVSGGKCPADREVFVRDTMQAFGATQADFEEVLSMAQRVRQAVADRRVPFFLPR
jgi:hypothetical protein